MVHENSIKNLKPAWTSTNQPAVKGNITGTPHAKTQVNNILSRRTSQAIPGEDGNEVVASMNVFERAIWAQVKRAWNGDTNAIQWLADRGYGKVGSENDPVQLSQQYDLTRLTTEQKERRVVLLTELMQLNALCVVDPNEHIEAVEYTESK